MPWLQCCSRAGEGGGEEEGEVQGQLRTLTGQFAFLLTCLQPFSIKLCEVSCVVVWWLDNTAEGQNVSCSAVLDFSLHKVGNSAGNWPITCLFSVKITSLPADYLHNTFAYRTAQP